MLAGVQRRRSVRSVGGIDLVRQSLLAGAAARFGYAMRARRGVILVVSALVAVVGCSSFSGSSVHLTSPSKYDGARLCDRYRTFLQSSLSITDAEVETLTFEEGGVVGWSTICNGRHSGLGVIGALQVHNPRIDDGKIDDIPTDYRPVPGFEGKAWVGVPMRYWTEVHVQDGLWSAEMRFVKTSPEQELLKPADAQAVTTFLVQIAHDLKG
ncbi:hypothetical protein OHB26_05800 [Nocardia sp. NBC_01503]|uniref:hypothetical protein n=1 Tax=Nocardia sp. NBC_01503 TaxID=2975997 RepID=UPI002E7C1224|nr:hypothetical protein [Nocardia sp. NBC_01503]WTL33737.1 hypothetical protein OHB26_05800 [Nocardia sp. NBC_01503]